MARYNLTLRDGSTIQVEAPENASQEEILRRANRQRTLQGMQERFAGREEGRQARLAELDAMRPPPPEEETGFFGDLAGGFASGVVGVGETAALGAATLLDEEEELAARERIQGAASAIRPSFGDEEDLTFKIASAFGSIAGFLGVGAAVTYGAGAAGLGAAGAGIAGLLGAGALGVGAGAGEASERARAAGATEEERNRAARLGALVGSTEALPLRRILGKLTGDLGEEVVQGFRNRVVSALRTGGEEAAQEAGASIAQNLIERGYNIDQAILEGSGEAGALGGGAGATIQVLVDLFAGRRAPSAPPPPEQGELFPGADLGQAPTRVMGDQREMFPDEDLGLAPERPDERQGDLFSAQDQQSAAFARTARRADEERARMMGRPIADFETDGDPFLERTKAERDAARAEVARLQRPQQPEPEQRDMIRELEETTARETAFSEEQRAQAAAREREGLRAAGVEMKLRLSSLTCLRLNWNALGATPEVGHCKTYRHQNRYKPSPRNPPLRWVTSLTWRTSASAQPKKMPILSISSLLSKPKKPHSNSRRQGSVPSPISKLSQVSRKHPVQRRQREPVRRCSKIP
jgi:hypothetical protein